MLSPVPLWCSLLSETFFTENPHILTLLSMACSLDVFLCTSVFEISYLQLSLGHMNDTMNYLVIIFEEVSNSILNTPTFMGIAFGEYDQSVYSSSLTNFLHQRANQIIRDVPLDPTKYLRIRLFFFILPVDLSAAFSCYSWIVPVANPLTCPDPPWGMSLGQSTTDLWAFSTSVKVSSVGVFCKFSGTPLHNRCISFFSFYNCLKTVTLLVSLDFITL